MHFYGQNDQPAASTSGKAKNTRALSGMRMPLRAQAGNAIFQVIFVLSILIISIYLLTDRIQGQRKIVMQTGSVLKARFALQSIMDYTYFAIQRRYCLNETLLAASNCKLNYGVNGSEGRSIERILLSGEQALNMKEMINLNNIDLGLGFTSGATEELILAVDHLDIRVKAKDIGSTHPLYPMIAPLEQVMRLELKDASKFKNLNLTIRVQINREDFSWVPRTGNEVYFTVKVSLEDGTSKVLTINNITKLQVSSYGAMSPRELGSFALMIGRDLRLDGGDASANGDVGLPVLDTKTPGPGLVFMSPVFVNRNVHLPFVSQLHGGQKTGFTHKYSPITFADRLILGRGSVYEEDNLYKPESAGGRGSTLWTDNKLFGGFKSGVLVDGFFDKGLNIFSKVQAALPVSDALMQQCNARYQVLTDVDQIKASDLYGNYDSSSPSAGPFKYDLGFTGGNAFKTNGAAFVAPNLAGWGTGTMNRELLDAAPNNTAEAAVLMVGIRTGTSSNTREASLVQLRKNSRVTFVGEHDWPAYTALLDQKKLDAEALPPGDPAIAEVNAKIAELQSWKANPPTVKITVNQVSKVSLGQNRDQTNRLSLQVEIINSNSFRDSATPVPNAVAPRIELLGYDGVHDNNYSALNSMTTPVNYVLANKTRFLNFEFDGAGAIQAPVGFSMADRAAPIDPSISNDTVDYAELDERCRLANNAATGQSFGAVEWNIDLADKSTFKSWNYADNNGTLPGGSLTGADDVAASDIIFNSTNSKWYPLDGPRNVPTPLIGRDEFKVRSIAETCTIQPGAQLVTGFFTCHTLVIEKRTLPLYIIGTFIVRKIIFADSGSTTQNDVAAKAAMNAGIFWMSIYHPEAVLHLRHAGVLKPKLTPSAPCLDGASATDLPIWAQSSIKISRLSDNRACNVVSLRSKSNPMQWTAVDPDCGLQPLPGGGLSSATVCKKHPVNFFVLEHARGGGP